MNLSNKVAVIAGGARMGTSVAGAFARRGCAVSLLWRNSRQAAEKTAAEITAQGGKALALQCDLSKPAQLDRVLGQVVRQMGRLDVAVNLASLYELVPLTGRNGLKAWDDHMAAHLRSACLFSLAVVPWLKRSGGGRLIHISDWTSASGRPRYKDYTPYYVSKAAVKALVEALALELAPSILVNAIAPGPMLPPPTMSKREIQAVSRATPLGRWGGPEEMAKAILFLAETDFMTGETIRLDGGRHLF